jgi:hypothetical protein
MVAATLWVVGLAQIECWGEYANAPTSLCFEKSL